MAPDQVAQAPSQIGSQVTQSLFAGIAGNSVTGTRARPELARLLALLDGPHPIRAQRSGDLEFRQFLARVHEAVSDAQAHQDLPLAMRRLAALVRDEHGFSDGEPGTGGFASPTGPRSGDAVTRAASRAGRAIAARPGR